MTNPVDSLPPDVVEAWRQGHKIEAIKRLREATGMGLAPGEVPRSKGALGIVILAIAAAIGAWLYSRL